MVRRLGFLTQDYLYNTINRYRIVSSIHAQDRLPDEALQDHVATTVSSPHFPLARIGTSTNALVFGRARYPSRVMEKFVKVKKPGIVELKVPSAQKLVVGEYRWTVSIPATNSDPARTSTHALDRVAST